MTKLKFGILGASSFALRSIVPLMVSGSLNIRLESVASRDPLNAGKFFRGLNVKIYDSYAELLATSDIDAVYIPLPSGFHYEYAKKALLSGKHVLVEKPLALSLEQAGELIEIARVSDLALLENFQFRFHSQLAFLLEMCQGEEIGEIRAVRVSFGFPPFKDSANIRYRRDLGGGAFFDVGVYALRVAPFFLKSPMRVTEGAVTIPIGADVDLWGSGTIRQDDGAGVCQFAFGFDHDYQCSIEIWGSRATVKTNRIFTLPPKVQPRFTVSRNGHSNEIYGTDDNHFLNMLAHFVNLTTDPAMRETEYESSLCQAELMRQFLSIARINEL